MNYTEYFLLLASAPWLYLVAITIAFAIYGLFLRKQIESVFDPLFVNMVFAAIGTGTVFFLLLTKSIDSSRFDQYISTELLYLIFLAIIPLQLGKVRARDELLAADSPRRLLQCIYLVSAATFLVAQPLVYILNGIPLFLESRLDYYSGGGGIGLFGRIIPVSSYFCWYLLLHKYTYKWKVRYLPRAFDAILVICLIASSVLSGAKGDLLVVVFLIFYFRTLHGGSRFYSSRADRSLRRMQRIMFGAAVCGAFVVLAVGAVATSAAGLLGGLAERIASSGDAYFMAYPGNTLQVLDGTHPILAIFGSTLSMFRLIDPASVPQPLGFQIFHYVVQSSADLGPNPRHNLFGLVYFGVLGSLVYSATLGLSVALVRNVAIRHIKLGGVSELIYVFVVLQAINVNTGLEILIFNLANLCVIAPLLIGVAYILNAGSRLALGDVYKSASTSA